MEQGVNSSAPTSPPFGQLLQSLALAVLLHTAPKDLMTDSSACLKMWGPQPELNTVRLQCRS